MIKVDNLRYPVRFSYLMIPFARFQYFPFLIVIIYMYLIDTLNPIYSNYN